MEKGSSSSSASANTTKLTLQLFGTTMETAPPPAAAAGNASSAAASPNALAGSTQGEDNLFLSLQLASASAPTMVPAPMPAPLAMAPAATVAQNASLAAVANALAQRRRNVSAELMFHLRRCVESLVAARSADADAELASVMRLASPDGDATQRMAVAFAEALARVTISPWRGVSAALFATVDDDGVGASVAREAAVARQNFLNVCPLLRLARVAVNELILDATKDDKLIHVVDLGGVNHGQWMELIAALASRWQGRPSVRLTVVIREPGQFYSQACNILTNEATRHGLPFELHVVESSLEALKLDALVMRSDHAVVIVSTLQLHRLVGAGANNTAAGGIASSLPVATSTMVDNLLCGFHLLSPRLIIVTENEANHFGPGFRERFISALEYYEQLFSSVEESSALCQPAERKAVERHVLKEEIKDIIACEDRPRWARHEPLGRWIVRMGAAGFVFWPTSIILAAGRVRSVAAQLPGGGHRYGVTEGDGWLILNRMNKPMFCVSAWRRK